MPASERLGCAPLPLRAQVRVFADEFVRVSCVSDCQFVIERSLPGLDCMDRTAMESSGGTRHDAIRRTRGSRRCSRTTARGTRRRRGTAAACRADRRRPYRARERAFDAAEHAPPHCELRSSRKRTTRPLVTRSLHRVRAPSIAAGCRVTSSRRYRLLDAVFIILRSWTKSRGGGLLQVQGPGGSLPGGKTMHSNEIRRRA